jgi:hypothetical protein
MMPAPRKPTPVMICAATRDGSSAMSRLQDIGETVFADEHEQRGADADEAMGAQPAVLLPDLTFHADRG